jgi:hypothetical protein
MQTSVRVTLLLLALPIIAAGQGPKTRAASLASLICQSDIVAVGPLNTYLAEGIEVITTATDAKSNRYPYSSRYDQGQIIADPPEAIRFLKDDPSRTTVNVINVVVPSTSTSHDFEFDPGERISRDSNQWIWLLHREHSLGQQYLVLKQLPVAEESKIVDLLKDGKCRKP